MTIAIKDNIRLEITAQKHAPDLFEAINANRAHLSAFLPWVGNMQSINDVKSYIANCDQLYQQQKEVSFVIYFEGVLAGRIGLHHIHQQNKQGAIGYWLSKHAEGKGIITACCRWLIGYGFKELELHRIEIKAATANIKSQAIPEKLQFTREGILREAELVNDSYLDLVLYSMLGKEWEAAQAN